MGLPMVPVHVKYLLPGHVSPEASVFMAVFHTVSWVGATGEGTHRWIRLLEKWSVFQILKPLASEVVAR